MTNPTETEPKVIITGASGMLGRALYRVLMRENDLHLHSSKYIVKGLGFSRSLVQTPHLPHLPPHRAELQKLNLLDYGATSAFLQEYQPDIIVHCAAERFPDAFESNLDKSIRLNVDATKHLANECLRLGNEYRAKSRRRPYLIYISTSYVFDGGVTSKVYPPYKPDSKTNPINSYGKSKWDGECVIRDILNNNDDGEGQGMIVRVPLLYGEDCSDLNESPVLETMKVNLPSSIEAQTEPKKIDNWALRFPTSVEDVSEVLRLMIDELLKDPNDTAMRAGTYHVASSQGCTKYELLHLQSKLLSIPEEVVKKRAVGSSAEPPTNAAPRPQCTQLDCSDTWKAIGQEYEFVKLQDGMSRALYGYPERFV